MKDTLQNLKDNLSFVFVSVAIFAALVLVSMAAERFLIKERRKIKGAHYIAYMAMFSALAAVLMTMDISLFFAPFFYKLDFSEIPVLICAFSMGPTAGVICEFVKVVVKILLTSTQTAFVGDFANFAVGCSFVLPASIIYHTHKTFKRAVVSLVVGGLIMTAFGSLFNGIYLIPTFARLFYKGDMGRIIGEAQKVNKAVDSVGKLVALCVVPFNLVKAVVVSVITLPLYKRVKRFLRMDR